MNRPEPVYLLLGPESGGKAQRIKEIRALCRARNDGEDAEIHRFYPFETEEGEILGALKNSSLFSGYRLVLLAEAENLKAAQASLIASYLKNPSDSATLIITSAKNSVHPAIMKAVTKTQKEMFWELFENQKKDWLISFFTSQKLDISLEAVEVILSLVENNTQELRAVSQRFSSYFHSLPETTGEITVSEVEQFIYHSRQESVFTLFARIAEADLTGALEILTTLQLSGEAEPVQLFGGLLWQFRRLHSFMSFLEEGDTEQEAFSRASVLGKKAAVRGKHNQQIYRSAARRYAREDVQRIISAIGRADAQCRELGAAASPIIVELLIYSAVRKHGRLETMKTLETGTAVL